MGKIYINCSRCGKDLECEELCDVYTSKIDDSFICKDCYKKEKPDYIQQLKQQLAEKDKELIYMTKQAKKFNNEAQKYYEDAYCNGLQNQKAIAELEEVKTLIQNAINFETNFVGVYDAINNQIKELKGEKECND